MKKDRIPTILGLAFLILGAAAGVVLINNKQLFRLRASPEISPKGVRVSNINEDSFTVSWTTDKETQGFIRWGEEASTLNKTSTAPLIIDSFTHSFLLKDLSPEHTYYFEINSDGKDFDNNGVSWQVKTGADTPLNPEAYVISGLVTVQTGTPVKNALVYFTVGGGSLLSTTTSENGNWAIPISTARTQSLTSYVPINELTTLVEISVQAGPLGTASAQIYPASAKPAPPIILGQNHNFKNLSPEKEENIPEASVTLPEESSPSSGFIIPEETPTPTTTVTLENLEEGGVLKELKPKFLGAGPAGATLNITIESEPVTDTTEVEADGNWNWSPSTTLSVGTHKITIQWKDAKGILRTLTRSFIVQAVEQPTSTPTTIPSPTPTPRPTQAPTPTPLPTTKRATDSAIPESGILTPTLLLFIISLASFVLAGLILSFPAVEE